MDEGGDCCAYGRHPFEGGEGAVLVCSEPALDQRSTPKKSCGNFESFDWQGAAAQPPKRRFGGTNTLVRCPQSGHSYAISPGSPATPRSVVTPLACISLMIGMMFAAKRSALALLAAAPSACTVERIVMSLLSCPACA